jgi:hypothetical protein
MKITSTHIVEISYQQIIDLVKQAYNLEGKIELIISDKAYTNTDNVWIHVPTDWNHYFPPLFEVPDARIEVKYRNGTNEFGAVDNWACSWAQTDDEYDIVAYRILK